MSQVQPVIPIALSSNRCRGSSLVDPEAPVEPVHEPLVDEGEGDEGEDRAGRGEPVAEREAQEPEGVEPIGEEDPGAERDRRPDREKRYDVEEVSPPVGRLLSRGSSGHSKGRWHGTAPMVLQRLCFCNSNCPAQVMHGGHSLRVRKFNVVRLNAGSA